MPNFSQEYKDFVIQSKAIQAAWQKRGVRVGDWVYGTKHNNMGLVSYHLVQRTDLTMTPALAVDLRDGEYWVYGTAKTSGGTPEERILQDWRWLPTLSDLLDMVVDAVKEKEWGEWPDRPAEIILGFDWGSKDWYADVMGGHANALVADESQEEFFDKELAAARLLERVLAGKEE